MANLANPADLALLVDLPEDDQRVALALRRASGRFIDAVGWPVLEEEATVTLTGDGGRTLWLPGRNVTAATATIDDKPVTGTKLDRRLGALRRASGWPDGTDIEVTFTAGWEADKVPDGIQDAVLEHAAHIGTSLGLFSQESTGTSSASYSAAATTGATQKWVDAVARYAVGVGERS